ncbi:MAG: hypothetical protein V3W11_09895 [bacterium]
MVKDTNFTPGELLAASRCPKCGGALGAPEGGNYTCEYCGTTFLPRELVGGKSIDLREFYGEAIAAVEEGNYGQAYEYFNRIIETDAAEYQAWAGKGIAGAYAKLSDDQQFEPGEIFSCVDMALAYYDAEDKELFGKSLADRLGALAVDLFDRVMEEQVNDQKNLSGLLDLLYYWEENGTEELESWIAIVAVAEKPAVPPKAKRKPGVTYLTFDYPFKNVAKKYTRKIRAKYDPEFTNVFERGADAQAAIVKGFKTAGKILIIVAGVAVGLAALFILTLIILAALGYTYFI